MPAFKSKAQVKACYAAKDPKWDCSKASKATKSIKALPNKVKAKTKKK